MELGGNRKRKRELDDVEEAEQLQLSSDTPKARPARKSLARQLSAAAAAASSSPAASAAAGGGASDQRSDEVVEAASEKDKEDAVVDGKAAQEDETPKNRPVVALPAAGGGRNKRKKTETSSTPSPESRGPGPSSRLSRVELLMKHAAEQRGDREDGKAATDDDDGTPARFTRSEARRARKTPKSAGRRKSLPSAAGAGGVTPVKVPKTPGMTPNKTPGGGQKRRMWCSSCRKEGGRACKQDHPHQLLELGVARKTYSGAFEAAKKALDALDDIDRRGAPRLSITAWLRDPSGGEGEPAELTVSLASWTLSPDERAALCAYLEGLALYPERDHLSASSAGCEAIATKCSRLPDRVEGITLCPGALLLLGRADEDGDDAAVCWLGRLQPKPALRIYYGSYVLPHQARTAKVLGYVTDNLEHLAKARPSAVAYGEEGRMVALKEVHFLDV